MDNIICVDGHLIDVSKIFSISDVKMYPSNEMHYSFRVFFIGLKDKEYVYNSNVKYEAVKHNEHFLYSRILIGNEQIYNANISRHCIIDKVTHNPRNLRTDFKIEDIKEIKDCIIKVNKIRDFIITHWKQNQSTIPTIRYDEIDNNTL